MSHSTPPIPQPNGDKAHAGIEPANLVELVAGDPPVPITVWRTARDVDRPGAVPTRLAYRLVSAYSRPGETVIDFTDGYALTGACLRGRRRHHKARFTRSGLPVISPATPPITPKTSRQIGSEASLRAGCGTDSQTSPRPGSWPGSETSSESSFRPRAGAGSGPNPRTGFDTPSEYGPGPEAGADTREAEPPDLTQWFGDDLTDPALPPPTPATAALPTDYGHASLLVARWPLDASSEQANRIRLAGLLTICSDLLRPGGCLVLVAGVPHRTPAVPEDFRPLLAAASAAGLGYLQYIVAVTADTDGDQFTYFATDEELLSLAAGHDPWQAVTHLPVHATCLVFAQTEATQPERRR